MLTVLTIDWLNQQWTLLPEKALHWPAQRAVIVADVHFGKAAAFRHHGVPVPEATTARDLVRLSTIINATRCERLIVLGDLLHAQHGRSPHTMLAVEQWRNLHRSLVITLVRGNHDRSAGDPPESWRIEAADEPFPFAGLSLQHDPATSPARRCPLIAGHVHPCVRMRDVDGSSMRSACFVFNAHSALLPAFGSFTGGQAIKARRGDRIFAVGPSQVLEIAAAAV